MAQNTPPGWYSDPQGSGQQRYWDGNQWTPHLNPGQPQQQQQAQQPQQKSQLEQVAELDVSGPANASQIQQQVQHQAGVQPAQRGGGTLFTEPVLVVNQKTKLIELNNEYAIYDQDGTQIGAVRQVGQSLAKKAIRVLTSYDQFMTHKLQVVDAYGNVLLALTRPAKMLKSRVIVQNGMGAEIGQIVQQNAIGKIRFSLEAGGHSWGSINA
ncbi:MAG: DUF2510 domain-containing protein, partial [Stackebrandtia sp.]